MEEKARTARIETELSEIETRMVSMAKELKAMKKEKAAAYTISSQLKAKVQMVEASLTVSKT